MALTATPLGFNISLGPGSPITYIGSDPAAGAEFSEAVPSGKVWRLISVSASLTTSAVAVTRQTRLTITDGTNTILQVGWNSGHSASLTARHSWAVGAVESGSAATSAVSHHLPALILGPGAVISVSTQNLDAGDNWTAPAFYVEEWDA